MRRHHEITATSERGVALLAVLWLSVALTLIAMTTSYLVRTEASAVSNHVAAERAGFLARGGIDTAMYAMLRAGSAADAATESGVTQRFQPGQRLLQYEFADGAVEVEIVPENAKLNVNLAPVEQLTALFTLLGEEPDASREIAEAIADWRAPRPASVDSPFDSYYAGLDEPYQARHSALDELDELLVVKGMTRDLFFGRHVENADATLQWTPPLADLLTTEAVFGGVNTNYAAAEVLRVQPGWDEGLAARVIEARNRGPFRTLEELQAAVPEVAARLSVAPVVLAAGPAYTLTATAQMRDSAVRRTVRARILFSRNAPMGLRVTSWWQDWPWSNQTSPASDALQAADVSPVGGSRL